MLKLKPQKIYLSIVKCKKKMWKLQQTWLLKKRFFKPFSTNQMFHFYTPWKHQKNGIVNVIKEHSVNRCFLAYIHRKLDFWRKWKTALFYKEPVCKQLALGWQIANQHYWENFKTTDHKYRFWFLKIIVFLTKLEVAVCICSSK